MELKAIIRTAAAKNNIGGVMELTALVGISFHRVLKVWNGDTSAKLNDVMIVCNALNVKLSYKLW